MKKALFLFVLLIGQLAGNTQVTENQLEVTGFAEMEIDPDIIVLRINTESIGFNSGRYSQMLLAEKEMQIFLKSIGIDPGSFMLDNFTSVSNIVKSPPGLSSIKITKSYSFHINNTGQLENVIKKFTELGYENIQLVRVGHSELERIQNELLKKAAQAARQKAEILAENLQFELGKATSVNEIIGFGGNKDQQYCQRSSQNDPRLPDRILYHPYETLKYGDNPSKLKLRLAKSVSVKYYIAPK